MKSSFKFFAFDIRYYSIALLLSFTLAYIFIIYKSKNIIDRKRTSDFFFNLALVSLLGARIYYCVFNYRYYFACPLDIIKVWEGGLAIHGGIIFGILYLVYYCRKNKLDVLKLTDIIVPSLALGQAIGRWGNFFNQEAYGPITTYNFLNSIHIPSFIIKGMYINNHYYHPTFFYESLGCLVLFIILMLVSQFLKLKRGIITSIYLIIYGIIRFFIEILRQDSLMFFSIKVAQIVSILMILIGISIIIKEREND